MFNFGWELWIALKYVFSSKREKFTGIITLIAIIGVTLSVGALTVVNSVITGFKEAVSEKILSLNPHLSVTFRNPEYEKRITEIIKKEIPSKEIKSIQKVSTLQGLIIFSGQPVGIVLKATNLQQLQKEKGFKKFEFNPLYLNSKEKALPVIIGEKLRERLGLVPGEKVKFMSAEGFYTPFGFFPKVITFVIAGTFQTGIYDYDLNLVFVPFDAFSTSPCRSASAPVKAPFLCPKSVSEKSVSSNPATFTGTKGPVRRLSLCMARANSSFPTPVSPVRRTG